MPGEFITPALSLHLAIFVDRVGKIKEIISVHWHFQFKFKVTEYLLKLFDFIFVSLQSWAGNLKAFTLTCIAVLVLSVPALISFLHLSSDLPCITGGWPLQSAFPWLPCQLASGISLSVGSTGRKLADGKGKGFKLFLPFHLCFENHLWQWSCLLWSLSSHGYWLAKVSAFTGWPWPLALVLPPPAPLSLYASGFLLVLSSGLYHCPLGFHLSCHLCNEFRIL